MLALALALALAQAAALLGSGLAPGLQLQYTSNGQPQPLWVVDSIRLGAALLPGADCAVIHLRRRPDQPAPDETRVCARGDTLHGWNARRNAWVAQRPIGPGMTMTFPQANGDTVTYTTRDRAQETVASRSVDVLGTTVLTVDSLGRPKRRLRERYAPGLLTATYGTFEVPDSTDRSLGGWRIERTFELRDMQPRP